MSKRVTFRSQGGIIMNIHMLIIALLGSLSLLAAQPLWDNRLDFEEIEHRLKHERIVEIIDMHTFLKKSGKIPSGTHPIQLAILESGLKAVFKKPGACYGEIAAYNMAKALGMRIVPPTVMREIKGVRGSLQFYVESSIDLMRSHQDYRSKLDEKTISHEQLFNYLMCRWDIHAGNQILAKHKGKYYLALIDNAGVRSLIHTTKNKITTMYASTLEKLKVVDRPKLELVWHELLKVNRNRTEKLIDLILTRKEQIIEVILKTKIKKKRSA